MLLFEFLPQNRNLTPIICTGPVTPCPGGMFMALYVAGRLGPDQRQLIEGHLLQCQRCREIFIITIYSLTGPEIDPSLLRRGELIAASARLLSLSQAQPDDAEEGGSEDDHHT